MREDTVQIADDRAGRRRHGRLLSAALVCIVACLFCGGAGQIAARGAAGGNGGGSQPLPPPAEEETHEGQAKASKALAASWRKAPQRCPLTVNDPDLRAVFRPSRELRSDLAERWDAHSDRRRGPPSSLPLS